jgi:ABC-type nitrate/sulfonate/bicarbonate transport system substrate-binding protein
MFFIDIFRKIGGCRGRSSAPVCRSFFIASFVVILIGAAAIGIGIYSHYHRAPAPRPAQITIGIAPTENAALVYIASDLGLFVRYGLDVRICDEPGNRAMAELEEGSIDIAGVPELALVSASFQREDIRAIAAISMSNDIQLVARIDRGIDSPEDLKGKTIGVSRGITCRFFLDTFLAFNGILPGEVQVVEIGPSETVASVLKRGVDALMLLEPLGYAVRTALGDRAIVWEGQSGQDYYFLLTSTHTFVDTHEAAVRNLLRAIVDAERYAEDHPDEARKIVQRHVNLGDAYMESIWERTKPRVSLTQDLLIRMEDEVRWYKKRGLGKGRTPEFYTHMYLEGLDGVNPEAVSIIH